MPNQASKSTNIYWNKVKSTLHILCATLFLWCLSACSARKKSNDNLAALYAEHNNYLVKDLQLINTNDSLTQLWVQITPAKLLFVKSANENTPEACYEIRYVVYESLNKKTIADSARVRFQLRKDSAKTVAQHCLNIRAAAGKNYFVEITTRDILRKSQFTIIVDLSKKTRQSRHYFSAQQYNQNIGESALIAEGSPVFVQNKTFPNTDFYVKCYFRTFKLPLAPFDLNTPEAFNHNADSLLRFRSDSNGTFSFTPLQKGFYLIQADTAAADGFGLFLFNSEFPYIVHAQQLIAPLAYISSPNEFKNLLEAQNSKQAIDDFWEKNCGNKGRAKESIQLYYARIELTNRLFTSYREGWRTDRGMIFLIFGPPQLVYRTNEVEKWFYGADNSMMTEEFTFYKVNNPYSSNAYNLDRLATYKNLWYKMIEAWRDGRIY